MTAAPASAPHLDSLHPAAAMPGSEVHLRGAHLLHAELPTAHLGDVPARLHLCRHDRAILAVPDGAVPAAVTLAVDGHASNALPLAVAVPLAEDLHPVANPAVGPDGVLYATLSGPRGEQTPVSIFRIDRDGNSRPFVRDLLNATGLAFGPDGHLYASSRAEGSVYRITPEGAMSLYAEGLGVATGLAFDPAGNLYAGDRSGTIFKIDSDRKIFVFATLEPSVSAYHLAFNSAGTLFVTGPTASSCDVVYAIDPHGASTVYYRGLGRPQGCAIGPDGALYVAASLAGERGIVRIDSDHGASLVVSGNNLVGLAFTADGIALATHNALFHVAMNLAANPSA
jgi:sugar lactone lactonase YvrE